MDEQPISPHVAIIGLWFGPLPKWFPQFCQRVKANQETVRMILFTDQIVSDFPGEVQRVSFYHLKKYLELSLLYQDFL